MHDGMPYDPIQGQGHGASEVLKIALFQVCLIRHSVFPYLLSLIHI